MKGLGLFFFLGCMACTPMGAQTTVTFNLRGATNDTFDYVGIRGSAPPLSWDRSIRLEPHGDTHSVSLVFPDSIPDFEFKYVRHRSKKDLQWESLNNRAVSLEGTSPVVLDHEWNTYPKIDVSQLKKIPSRLLLEDFALIKTMVLEVHPGVYRYNSQKDMEVALNQLESRFQNDLAYGEAYLAVSELLASIQCDHTFASFYNQGPILKTLIHEQKDKLPFTFTWIGDKMIVLRNASAIDLKPGTEILTIHGVAVSKILDRLKKYAKADGGTEKSRVKQLEVSGYPYRYNAFDVYYPLVYPVPDALELDIKTPDGLRSQVIVQPLTREERSQTLAARYADFPVTKAMLWGYEKLQRDIGLLTAGTFDDMGMDRDWDTYFKQTFKTIDQDGIAYLIVDLRDNEGGFDAIGEGLMRHLIQKPVRLQEYIDKTRFTVFPESLKPYVQSWGDPWYYTPELIKGPDEWGYYERPSYKEPTMKPAKNAFQGEVFFLVGPRNVSMAYYLATGIQKNGVGRIIGEETGGNQRGINGGQLLFLRLPNSTIEIDVPVVGSFSLEEGLPNKGVIPDIMVSTKIEDLVAGRDTQLMEALDQIERLKNRKP